LLKNYIGDSLLVELDKSVASRTLGFRNKIKLSVTGNLEFPVLGLLGEDHLDSGREILACPLHHKKLIDLTLLLPDFIRQAKITPYSIENKSGELKGIIAFFSEESEEMYLRFVMRSQEAVTRIKKFIPLLQKRIPELKVVTVNVQSLAHALLEGDLEVFITDKKFIEHRLRNISMRLHPKGFVQTNQDVALALYETAATWTKDLEIKKFAELYSGQGAFSFFCAASVTSGLGIEINPEAVDEANHTAKILNLNHLSFKAADAAFVKSELEVFSPDLILVNPPRRGLGDTINELLEVLPEFILYSSCSGETLGADVRLLRHKYEIKKAQLFDMFPYTKHFETLVLLQRL
jgi:23S rRNA (uracil747-C5)-methyltransferase